MKSKVPWTMSVTGNTGAVFVAGAGTPAGRTADSAAVMGTASCDTARCRSGAAPAVGATRLLRHLAHRQHRLRARADVECTQHCGDVVLDRLDRQPELTRDQLVRLAFQQQPEHVLLARREA